MLRAFFGTTRFGARDDEVVAPARAVHVDREPAVAQPVEAPAAPAIAADAQLDEPRAPHRVDDAIAVVRRERRVELRELARHRMHLRRLVDGSADEQRAPARMTSFDHSAGASCAFSARAASSANGRNANTVCAKYPSGNWTPPDSP